MNNPASKTITQEESYIVENKADMMGGSVYKVLFSFVKQYPVAMTTSIALAVVSCVLQLFPHWIVYLLADSFFSGSLVAAQIYQLGLICLVGTAIGFSCALGSTYISHCIAANSQKDIRQKIANKLTKVPLGFFSTRSSHDFKTMVIDDVEAIEDGIAHLIPEITAAFLAPIIIIIAMLYMNPFLAIASVLGLVSGFFYMGMAMGKSQERTNQYYASKAKIGRLMSEIVSVLSVVKVFNQSNTALNQVEKSFKEYSEHLINWIAASVGNMNWFIVLSTSNLAFLLPFALWFYYMEWIDLATVIFFLLFATGLNGFTMKFYTVTHRFTRQANIFQKMNNLVTAQELPKMPTQASSGKYDIVFENVSFAYEQQTILSGVNLTIPQGSSLALVGPSGAGKSTIARLLPRFWDVQEGSIQIGGIDIRHLLAGDLADQMAFVFQENFLFSESILDNIKIGKVNASLEEIMQAAKLAQIHDFIETLPKKYETKIHSGLNLSGGQKQRICIARAILKNAPILVLDEATSYADPENEAELQQAINQLVKGKTLIVIAHRLSTIKNLDQIAVIVAGKVLEIGTHQELLAKHGHYEKMWQAHLDSKIFKIQTG